MSLPNTPFLALRSPFVLAGALSLFLAACGGQSDSGSGLDSGADLPPSVTATATAARTPAVTGVAINTRVVATFNKSMNASSLNASNFTWAKTTWQAAVNRSPQADPKILHSPHPNHPQIKVFITL
jgi:hypothetical protein